MTRNGKIARLPYRIRTQLNRRLQDGEQGKTLVEWVNGQPLAQEMLKEQFDGRPVNEQNLSEWKQGGYQEWLRHEESRALVEGLAEQHEELNSAAAGMEISDRFAGVLSAELVALTKKLLEEKTDPKERWQCLREVFRELSQLRRDDHRAVRTVIKRGRWEREVERGDEEARKSETQERKSRLIDLCFSSMQNGVMAEAFGGGEYGKYMADLLHRIKFDLPPPNPAVPEPPGKNPSGAVSPDQAQSK